MTFWGNFGENFSFLNLYVKFLKGYEVVWAVHLTKNTSRHALLDSSLRFAISSNAGAQDHLRSTSEVDFMWKFWSKNDVSQIDPGSLWEGPGTSRAPKNIKGMTKHPLGGVRKDVQKLKKTSWFEGFWDLIYSNFPCWRMCCLAAGLSGRL